MPRIFLDWDRPALHTAAELLVDHYRRGEVADLSQATVGLPGGRAGRRLKELLLEKAEARGLRLLPPRITTVGRLPELFHEPERPLADPVVTRRAWAEALREMDSSARERIFLSSPADDDLRGWDTLAAEVAKLHRDVAGAGHRFSDVARVCAGGALFFDDQERWTALSEAQERYAEILTETDRSDPDLARIEALGAAELTFEHDLWLVGVVEMPAIARGIIQRWGGELSVLIHAPEAEADGFNGLGCVRPEVWGEREIDYPAETLRIAERPSDQADVVLGELAGLGDGYAPEEIAIAVPHDEVAPYLEQRLEAWQVPARSAAGTPIVRTPTYRLLAAISDHLRSGGRWEAFAALLRHPEVGRWLSRPGDQGRRVDVGGAIAEADRLHAKRLPLRAPAALRPPTEEAPLEAALHRIASCLEPLRTSRALSAWPKEIFAATGEILGDRTLSRDNPEERRLLDTLGALRSAALSISRLPGRLDLTCDGATAIDLLLETIRGQAVPDDPDRASVELLGWLELPLDDAPVAFVTGFNEPFLPESITAHAFLPDRLRSAVGMLDNRMRYARDAYHLTALLHDRARVRIVTGRVSATGDPLHPSRLMLAARGEELARRIQRFAEGQPGTPATDGMRQADGTDESRFALPPEPEIEREPPFELPVTAFRTLLDDPYLWALTGKYDLRSYDDRAREMDGGLFGSLAHDVLQAFGHDAARTSTDEKEVAARLETLLDEMAEKRFGRGRRLPAVRLQLRNLRLRLEALARWQAEWAGQGWEIRFVEGRPAEGARPEGSDRREGLLRLPFEVDGEPIELTGRIDRIDFNPAIREWAVFDYKTSEKGDGPEQTHRKGREKAWIDLQLPLYRKLVCGAEANGSRLLPAEAGDGLRLGYILLPRDLSQVGECFADWSVDELDEAEEVARDVVRTVRMGRFAFAGAIPRYDPGLVALLGGRQMVAAAVEDEEGEG